MNNKFPKSDHRFNAFNQKLGAYYPDALLIIIMRPTASLTDCYEFLGVQRETSR